VLTFVQISERFWWQDSTINVTNQKTESPIKGLVVIHDFRGLFLDPFASSLRLFILLHFGFVSKGPIQEDLMISFVKQNCEFAKYVKATLKNNSVIILTN